MELLQDGDVVKRLSFDWQVRLALGFIVVAVTMLARTAEFSVINHLLTGFGIWVLLVVAYESRALGRSEYWHEFSVSRAKLSLFRIALFSLVAFDAWRQTEHMARYGTNGFNVSHLPWLDWLLPVPTSAGILIVYLLQAYLAVRIVLGVAVPASVRLLTVLYGYSYFISQVDSYQHHYFVFLLLVICCFVPWQQSDGQDAPTSAPGAELVNSWAVRLLLVQMAVLYGWATITKLDFLWLNGEALAPSLQSKGVEWMNYYARNLPGELYATPAQLTMIAEAILVLAVATRRLWYVALFLGVGLHLSIELANFEIGIFSFYMFGMYLLIVPDKAYQFCARQLEPINKVIRTWWRDTASRLTRRTASAWALSLAAIAGGCAVLSWLPFDEVLFVAVVTAVLALAMHGRSRRTLVYSGVSHAIACAVLVAFFLCTDTTHDMYKKLAGSHRRLGNDVEMYAAYTKLTKVSPDFGRSYHHMGHVHRRRAVKWTKLAADQTEQGHDEKAIASRRTAQQELERAQHRYTQALAAYQRTHTEKPEDHWAYLWEAILHEEAANRTMRAGKPKQAVALYRRAIRSAKQTLRLRPNKRNVVQNAQRILRHARAVIKRGRLPNKRRRRVAPPR